ncbi:MAG: DUF3644 domain-containing protein [Candidatus Tyrphobacter sp.]
MNDVRAAREEALLACDLLNDRRERNLDAFLAHMLRAWTHLLRALAAREGHREKGAAADLGALLSARYPDESNPVRLNVEFFVGLRRRTAHRFNRRRLQFVETLVSGKINALLLNFEKALVFGFGERYSLDEALRFPIFLSSLARDPTTLLQQAYDGAPASVLRYVEAYESRLDTGARVSEGYDFRIYLMPKASPAQRDLPIEFVDLTKLSPQEAQAVESARIVIRDRQVEAVNVDRLKASEVVARVQAVAPAFSLYHHTLAWRAYAIRPRSNATDPASTDARFAVYDRAHRDYLYTEAWVERLIRDLGENPDAVMASWKPPRRSAQSASQSDETGGAS